MRLEEVITRDYIANGNADLVVILADASQLERSLFMIADYTGIKVPAILLLNLTDVATAQRKAISSNAKSSEGAITRKGMGVPALATVLTELLSDYDKKGIIMELPPYHKPKWGDLFKYAFTRTIETLIKALKLIIPISIIFWFLAYTPNNSIEEVLSIK